MADGLSDENGNFELCGQSSDPLGSIDPVFKVSIAIKVRLFLSAKFSYLDLSQLRR